MKKVIAQISNNLVTSNDSEAFTLFEKSRFGEKMNGKIIYTLPEAMFLVDKNKIEILQKGKPLSKKEIEKKFNSIDKKFQIKYIVFKDLRENGYIVKTALKFGAEFRVYEKGFTPEEEHAKWIVFTEHESKKFSWHEFSAKNRIAHSTNKKLLLAIVDEEGDVTYYEVGWIKP
jgi:tRNA-intron endonuclease, archaea type